MALNPNEVESSLEVLLRLGTAIVIGGVIGINRDLHRKPAGLRVLALVAMGSSAATIASMLIGSGSLNQTSDAVTRTVQGIVSGIGFLGAGVILRSQTGEVVHGITTAASIWVAAVLGIACGIGAWRLAGIACALSILILTLGQRVERRFVQWGRSTIPPENADED